MKLSARSYAILWDAHAWVGAIASILIFMMFFLGAFALFAEELAPWQERAFRNPVVGDDAQALVVAQGIVDAEAALQPSWFGLSLPTDEEPWMRLWRVRGDGLAYEFVEPLTGARFDQRSELGDFLNELHFLEPLPHGRTIAGVASLVLLFLAATGLALQFGNIMRELVRFRPFAKQRRVFWSDAHKVIGVVLLPFFLLFGLSGAALGLSGSLSPLLAMALFDGDEEAMARVKEWPAVPGPSGTQAPAPDLREAYEIATARYPEATHRWFFISNLGDENVVVDLPGEMPGRVAPFTNVRLDRGGEIVWARDAGGDNFYAAPAAALFGLHFASWSSLGGKVIWALLALLGAFGILAGNLLWIERRRSREGPFDRFLARLTVGGCAGLAFAVAIIFVANQILPAELPGRSSGEKLALLIAWAGALLYSFLARRPADAAKRLLFAAGALMLLLPLLDAALHARIPFDPRMPWLLATELGLSFFALLLLGAAFAIGRLAGTSPVSASSPHPPQPEPTSVDPKETQCDDPLSPSSSW